MPVQILGMVGVVALLALMYFAGRTKFTLRRLAFLLILLGAFTSPWIGIAVVGGPPSDLMFVAALVLMLGQFLGDTQRIRYAGPMAFGVVLIGLAMVISAVDPPHLSSDLTAAVDPAQLVVTTGVIPLPSHAFHDDQRFLLALIVVPLLIGLLNPSVPEMWTILRAWALGSAVSAAVALTDLIGITHVQLSLLKGFGSVHRATGLTLTPNDLAATCVVALPVAVSWAFRGRPAVGTLLSGLLVFSLYLTGSRGGIGALAAEAVIALAVIGWRRLANHAMEISLGLLVLIGLGLAYGLRLYDASRLSGRDTQASDVARRAIQHQSTEAFQNRIASGSGFQYIEEAHHLYLQLLASGGLLALLGFAVYILTAMRLAGNGRRIDSHLGVVLLTSLLAWMAFGLFENEVVNRFLYVPVGLAMVLGLRAEHVLEGDEPASVDTAVAQHRATARGALIATPS